MTVLDRDSSALFNSIGYMNNGGGLNAGILLATHIPTRAQCIQKKFLPIDIQSGHARREIETLLKLRQCLNISRIMDYSIDRWRGTGCMYLPWYEQETLNELIQRHIDRGRRPIPRPFIWKVFLSLAEALCAMQTLALPDKIIHRDIKPANVFLTGGEPDKYARIVLGDFGCAVSTRGVVGRPVSRHTYDYRTSEHPQSYLVSDVYQVALVIISLYRLSSSPRQFLGLVHPIGDDESRTMHGILAECLKTHWRQRMDCFRLRESLRRESHRMRGEEDRLIRYVLRT